jgi:hypothetical protein
LVAASWVSSDTPALESLPLLLPLPPLLLLPLLLLVVVVSLLLLLLLLLKRQRVRRVGCACPPARSSWEARVPALPAE